MNQLNRDQTIKFLNKIFKVIFFIMPAIHFCFDLITAIILIFLFNFLPIKDVPLNFVSVIILTDVIFLLNIKRSFPTEEYKNNLEEQIIKDILSKNP